MSQHEQASLKKASLTKEASSAIIASCSRAHLGVACGAAGIAQPCWGVFTQFGPLKAGQACHGMIQQLLVAEQRHWQAGRLHRRHVLPARHQQDHCRMPETARHSSGSGQLENCTAKQASVSPPLSATKTTMLAHVSQGAVASLQQRMQADVNGSGGLWLCQDDKQLDVSSW